MSVESSANVIDAGILGRYPRGRRGRSDENLPCFLAQVTGVRQLESGDRDRVLMVQGQPLFVCLVSRIRVDRFINRILTRDVSESHGKSERRTAAPVTPAGRRSDAVSRSIQA